MEIRIPTLAHWLFFPLWLPVLACEAKDAFLASTDRTLGENPPLKVALFGTCMMLDGQPQWNHSTSRALGQSEEMIIIWIAVSGNAFFGVRFQVLKRNLVFHAAPPAEIMTGRAPTPQV
jgi:hypothetical protein